MQPQVSNDIFFVLLMFILQFLVETHFVIVTTKDEGMTSLKSTSLELISKDGDMLIWYVLLLGDMGGPRDKQQLVSQWMDWNASIETVDKVRFREYLVWWWFLRLCLILTKFLFATRNRIGKCLLILISSFRMFLFAFGQNC